MPTNITIRPSPTREGAFPQHSMARGLRKTGSPESHSSISGMRWRSSEKPCFHRDGGRAGLVHCPCDDSGSSDLNQPCFIPGHRNLHYATR